MVSQPRALFVHSIVSQTPWILILLFQTRFVSLESFSAR